MTKEETAKFRKLVGTRPEGCGCDDYRSVFDGPFDDCWPWIGTKDYHGYGRFAVTDTDGRRRYRPAHQVAWEIVHGPFPPELIACHTCCHPWCVNPNHVYPGTPKNNGHDAVRHHGLARRMAKCRIKWAETEWQESYPVGLA